MQNYDLLYSFIPALGAILISLYNWYALNQGGKIKPLKIVNNGLWSVKSDQKKFKNLFIPVIFDNVAIKPTLVNDIKISFINDGGIKEIEVKRRIELIMPSSMSGLGINQFRANYTKELVPFYPIPVPGQQGIMVMVDCFDSGQLELDTNYDCSIEVFFGNNKASSIQFPFRIESEDFEKSLYGIKWLRF